MENRTYRRAAVAVAGVAIALAAPAIAGADAGDPGGTTTTTTTTITTDTGGAPAPYNPWRDPRNWVVKWRVETNQTCSGTCIEVPVSGVVITVSTTAGRRMHRVVTNRRGLATVPLVKPMSVVRFARKGYPVKTYKIRVPVFQPPSGGHFVLTYCAAGGTHSGCSG